MKPVITLTAADIIQLLAYQKETGQFRWLPRDTAPGKPPSIAASWNKRYAGNVVFQKIDSHGYANICLHNKRYSSHRIAWAIVNGCWPDGALDHINGIKTDNRYANLRCVSHSENMRNMPIKSVNTSGATGVSIDKRTGKWRANIRANGQILHLGSFVRFEDALTARTLANMKYGYHPNHGRPAMTPPANQCRDPP